MLGGGTKVGKESLKAYWLKLTEKREAAEKKRLAEETAKEKKKRKKL